MTHNTFMELVKQGARFRLVYTGEVFTVDDYGAIMNPNERYSLLKDGRHVANVSKLTKAGIHWYAHIFNKRSSGVIRFIDIVKH